MNGRIVVHAGVDTEPTEPVLELLGVATAEGRGALERSGDPLACVEAAVRVLEADPLLNAGRGSVLNADGVVETDAGVVEGRTGHFAAVGALTDTVHPVSVAAELLRRRPGPVLLAGQSARRFAESLDMRREDLRTSEQVEIWRLVREESFGTTRSPFTGRPVVARDTVGCIAVAADGDIVAGSSTGGLLYKMPGRVGDAAVLGAGLFADDRVAVLCSGQGEVTIELCLAVRTAHLAADAGAEHAAGWAVRHGRDRKDMVGGVIVVDAVHGRVAAAHNAGSFPVVALDAQGLQIIQPARVA